MAFRRVNNAPDWDSLAHQRVRIYRNLLNHWITVQLRIPGKGWRVVGCCQSCLLEEVQFSVNLERHQWILANHRRTVCAWAEGRFIAPVTVDIALTPIPLGFNPFRSPDFYDKQTGMVLQPTCRFLAAIDNEVFVSSDALPGPVIVTTTEGHHDLSRCY